VALKVLSIGTLMAAMIPAKKAIKNLAKGMLFQIFIPCKNDY